MGLKQNSKIHFLYHPVSLVSGVCLLDICHSALEASFYLWSAKHELFLVEAFSELQHPSADPLHF